MHPWWIEVFMLKKSTNPLNGLDNWNWIKDYISLLRFCFKKSKNLVSPRLVNPVSCLNSSRRISVSSVLWLNKKWKCTSYLHVTYLEIDVHIFYVTYHYYILQNKIRCKFSSQVNLFHFIFWKTKKSPLWFTLPQQTPKGLQYCSNKTQQLWVLVRAV